MAILLGLFSALLFGKLYIFLCKACVFTLKKQSQLVSVGLGLKLILNMAVCCIIENTNTGVWDSLTAFLFFFFYILVSEAIFVYNVNSTIMDSALLGCSVPVKTNLKNLRFYWQDERKAVLYSFNKGKTMFTHVKDPYLNRTTAFTQEMTKGNISVLVKNLTLGDNGRIFEAYAAVFNGSETVMQTSKVCHANLYVTGKRGSWLCWCLCFMKKWVYQRNFWKRLFWVNTQSSH